jgi:RimJ/RimL family protein N-acetyltransferase
VDTADAFVAAWCDRTGATARTLMRHRLFVLGRLRPPAGVPGAPRLAGPDDLELLVRWRQDFAAEAMPHEPPLLDPAEVVTRQLAAGQGNVLWEVDGEPVSVAVGSVPAAGMSRIAAVWTPKEHRGNGYASAATAACSRWALDAGVEHVVLFTDLANPVSNSIYPKLGYRPVHDAVHVGFEP